MDLWTWPDIALDDARGTADNVDRSSLIGYDVEAVDGSIGKIDETTQEAGAGALVVDTGWWIFGRKRLLPAGTITSVDHDAAKVYLRCSKEQVKAAPDYDAGWLGDTVYRESLTSHYR
ncbi:MAG: PRC-barrel domain-containing protein [Acidimicrobiia bacterium]